MGQCFQGVGLTKWTSVIAKRCPNNADRTKANFDRSCIKNYLEAVARFPNIGDQLIFWLCMSKTPALMPMHKFTRHWVWLLSYLEGGCLHWTMDVPTAQEKSEQIFFMQPKVHQNKFANRWYLLTRSRWLPSLSSVKQPKRWLVFSRKGQAAKGKENGSTSCCT